MMKNKLYLILLIILGILPSCIEYVNMDSREEMPVVVNCVLTRDTVQTLRLYRMRVLSETGNVPVEGATVILQGKDNNGKFQTVAEFHRTEGINWEVKFQPEYDTDYGLLIKVPGKEDITATTRFPEDLRLIQCCCGANTAGVSQAIRDDNGNQYFYHDYGMYTAEIRKGKYYDEYFDRYYMIKNEDGTPFKAYLDVSENPCKIWVFSHTDTTYVSPGNESITTINEGFFQFSGSRQPLSKYVATNHSGADRFNIAPGRIADLHYWNRPNIPSEIIRTNYSQWCLYLCPEIPIFKGFVRIDHPANYRNGLNINDLKNSYLYSDRSFFIAGDYSDNYNSYPREENKYLLHSNQSFLNEVHFVSEEYDAYLRALYAKFQNKNDFVLLSYDYDNVYSNIKGGTGIFGADNITWDMVETVNRLAYRTVDWERLCPDAPRKTD